MSESRYIIKNVGESRFSLVKSDGFLSLPGIEKSCLPMALHGVDKSSDVNNTSQLSKQSLWKEYNNGSLFSNDFIFIDTDISAELKKKVVDAASREGAKFLDHWFLGSPASHVVCDSSSIKKYIGHADTLVTPHWIFKTVKERCLQRLVRLSSDLVRQVANILENDQINQIGEDAKEPGQTFLHSTNSYVSGNLKISLEDRRKYIEFAKLGVRNRRSRCMQVFELHDDGSLHFTILGSDLEAGHRPQYTVPPYTWFGSFPTLDVSSYSNDGCALSKAPSRDPELHYSLVGCTCAPAFQFEDFELATQADDFTLAPKAGPLLEYLVQPK